MSKEPKNQITNQSGKAQALKQVRALLLHTITQFFNRGPGNIMPTDCTIHMGIYSKAKSPIPAFNDAARAKRLKAELQYVINYDKQPVKFSKDLPYRFDATGILEKNSYYKNAYLDIVFQRADMVWDDEKSLRFAGILAADSIAEFSTVVRQRNFKQSFDRIIAPTGVRDLFVVGFFESLVVSATYDKNGKYYEKYKDPSPSDPSQREYHPDKLSDSFISHNFAEVIPVRDTPHVLIRRGASKVLFELFFDKDNFVTWEARMSVGFPAGADILEHLLFNNLDVPMEAIFFHTLDGSNKFSPPKIDVYDSKKNRATPERVIDPKVWVKEQWEEEKVEDRFKNEWDWFVAMLQMRFANRIYEVWVSESMSFALNRKALVFDPLDEASRSATGEFKKNLTLAMKKVKSNPEINYFFQGMPLEQSGKRRLIGTEPTLAYIRRIDDGLTTTLPINLFITDLKIANIFEEVYNRTKHLIPIIAVFSIIATLGIAGAVVGFGALWVGFKWLVKDQVYNQVSKKAVKEVIHRFRIQLQFLFVDTLVSMFPRSDMKYLEFLRGFLRGFARDAIESLLKKYETMAIHGPSAYRWYKMFNRIQAALEKVEEKIDALKGIIDAAAGRLLLERVAEIGGKAQVSGVLLFSNLYFLDYDSASPAVDTFYDLAGQKAPTRAHWEKNRSERLKVMLVAYSESLREATVQTIKAGTAVTAKSVSIGVRAVSISKDLLLLTKLSGHFGIVATIAGLGGLAGGVAADIAKNEGKVTLTVLDLLSKGPIALWKKKYTPIELNKLGQLLGHVVGGFFLNGAIFAKGTRLGNLKSLDKQKNQTRIQKVKNKAISSFVSSEFGHGHAIPIIKLVLSHYLLLLDRVKNIGSDVWDQTEKKISKLLYGTASYEQFQSTAKQPISFNKAKEILKLLDEILIAQLDELLKTPGLDEELKKAADYLKRANTPSWEDFIDGKSPKEFSERAMSFTAVMHLQNALAEMADMLELIIQPVRTAKGHEVSLNDILSILGITISEEEAFKMTADRLAPTFGSSQQP